MPNTTMHFALSTNGDANELLATDGVAVTNLGPVRGSDHSAVDLARLVSELAEADRQTSVIDACVGRPGRASLDLGLADRIDALLWGAQDRPAGRARPVARRAALATFGIGDDIATGEAVGLVLDQLVERRLAGEVIDGATWDAVCAACGWGHQGSARRRLAQHLAAAS